LGYEIPSVVDTCEDAIKKAEEDKPDLILMDIRIEGKIDGIETAEIIRNKFGIPVIFSTAYLDEERIERAKITMPFGYLLKSIQERDLKVTLEMALYVSKVDAERRKAEIEVRTQVDFLDSLVQQSPFAMWISDTTGIVIKTNRALQELLNLTDQQIVGHYNVLEDVNLEVQGVMSQVKSVFNLKKTAKFNIPWFGAKAGKDDFKSARDLWIKVTIFPIVDKKSNLLNVVCQWIDITERKQVETKLKASEKRFHDLVLCSADWIWEMDINGKYTYVSKKIKNVLGYNPDEFIGKTPFSLMPKAEAVRVGKIFEKIKSKKKPIVDMENWNITKDGKEVCLLTNGVPILDEEENIIGYRGVDKDITAFKNTEKAT
jgi:PAS domain S-box-containing protein